MYQTVNSIFVCPLQSLRLSGQARQDKTVGEIVNLMSVDAQRLLELMTYVHILWSGPFQIALALVFLWFTVGPSIFAGFGLMVLLIPVNALIGSFQKKFQASNLVPNYQRYLYLSSIHLRIYMYTYLFLHLPAYMYPPPTYLPTYLLYV